MSNNQTVRDPTAAPVHPLLCGDVPVDLEMYHLACHFVAIDRLRSLGLVSGGPDFDIDMMRAIETVGRRAGLRDATPEEVLALTEYFAAGGEWEREADDFVSVDSVSVPSA